MKEKCTIEAEGRITACRLPSPDFKLHQEGRAFQPRPVSLCRCVARRPESIVFACKNPPLPRPADYCSLTHNFAGFYNSNIFFIFNPLIHSLQILHRHHLFAVALRQVRHRTTRSFFRPAEEEGKRKRKKNFNCRHERTHLVTERERFLVYYRAVNATIPHRLSSCADDCHAAARAGQMLVDGSLPPRLEPGR